MRPRLLLCFTAAAITAHAQIDMQNCAFADCAVGATVVTATVSKAGPVCATQGATIFAYYHTHPTQPPGPERDRMEMELRLRAGLRGSDDPMRLCRAAPIGQRATVIEIGQPRTGLLELAPLDGSPSYWISSFDVKP